MLISLPLCTSCKAFGRKKDLGKPLEGGHIIGHILNLLEENKLEIAFPISKNLELTHKGQVT